MTVKEKIEKEIAQLSQHELMKLHEIIVLLHKDRKLPNEVLNTPPPYIKVREALKGIGNLSDSIIFERTETLWNTHDTIISPTENEYVGIGFADLRFHQTIEKQIFILMKRAMSSYSLIAEWFQCEFSRYTSGQAMWPLKIKL